jgi:hypothetical protein
VVLVPAMQCQGQRHRAVAEHAKTHMESGVRRDGRHDLSGFVVDQTALADWITDPGKSIIPLKIQLKEDISRLGTTLVNDCSDVGADQARRPARKRTSTGPR